jgi:hypothetical protein
VDRTCLLASGGFDAAEAGTIRVPAGWIGTRLTRKLGIPEEARSYGFEVDIRHDADALHWHRSFDNGVRASSVFRPVGTWPKGYWIERTGFLRMRLTVDVIDGGWYWRGLGAEVHRLPLPLRLFPRSKAYKRIEAGRYFFCVEFVFPWVGRVLRYAGTLDAKSAGFQ